MKVYGMALLALSAALVGGCQSTAAPTTAPVIPTVQYKSNSINVPGYVSTCDRGQPGMNYNCPEDRN